jgi:hypothetical protein
MHRISGRNSRCGHMMVVRRPSRGRYTASVLPVMTITPLSSGRLRTQKQQPLPITRTLKARKTTTHSATILFLLSDPTGPRPMSYDKVVQPPGLALLHLQHCVVPRGPAQDTRPGISASRKCRVYGNSDVRLNDVKTAGVLTYENEGGRRGPLPPTYQTHHKWWGTKTNTPPRSGGPPLAIATPPLR